MTLGKIIAESVHGLRTIQCEGLRNETLPVDDSTACDLGSITKIISTTSIIMKLVETKNLALDHEVKRYLPEWSAYPRPGITVADLLEHQAGLNEWRPLYISQQGPTDARTVIANQGHKYSEGRHYSDLGFITLGNIIIEILNTSLDVAFTELVGTPLALSSTKFAHPVDASNVFASSYGDRAELEMVRSQVPYSTVEIAEDFSGWRNQILEGEVNDGNCFHIYGGVSGHAGLFSTAADLLTYGEAILASLNGNGYFDSQVLSTFLTVGRDPVQGYGFRTWEHEGEIEYWGHTGFPGTALGIDVKSDSVAVLLTNRLLTREQTPKTEDLFSDVREKIRNRYKENYR
jgi:CubicO group peptidase (beta-lactamase class C family)